MWTSLLMQQQCKACFVVILGTFGCANRSQIIMRRTVRCC
jgi:hypothetical protein